MTIVPLDATADVPVTAEWFEGLARHHVTAAATSVHDLMAASASFDSDFYFWDELTAAIAVDPDLATLEQRRLSVETDGAAAGRILDDDAGTPVTLAVAADRPAFEAELMTTLNGGTPLPALLAAEPAEITYFEAVERSTTRFDRDLGLLYRTPEAAALEELLASAGGAVAPEQDPIVRQAMRSFWTGALDLLAGHRAVLVALDPPPSLRAVHDAFVADVGAVVDSRDRVLAAIDSAAGADLADAFWQPGPELDAMTQSCEALQDAAAARGLDADLCSDE